MSRHPTTPSGGGPTDPTRGQPPVDLNPPRRARRASAFIIDSLLILPVGCVIALVWANTRPESYFQFARALEFPVNDIGIVFFFALVAKEVVEATLPGGALHPWRRAAVPVAAALGGVVVPIVLYLAFLQYVGEPMLMDAWAVPCAVDIAACYLVAGLIFGRHPAIPFLLLLAISSNVIGLTLLAAVHPVGLAHLGIAIGLMVAAIASALGLRRSHVRPFWPYVLGSGALSWTALFLGGLHPALALVPIVPFLPHAKHDDGLFVDPAPPARDTLTRFEHWWRFPVQIELLLFGLVNAGVPLHGLEPGTWAIPLATMAGRPLGVMAGAGIALVAGLHRTAQIGWRELIVIGCTASIGLTVALFFSAAVTPFGPLLLQMKMGALLTVLGGALAFGAAALLGVGRFARRSDRP